MELLQQVESGKWGMGAHSEAEIAGFLSSVARNALADVVRRAGRRREVMVGLAGEAMEVPGGRERVGADHALESREFAGALRTCVEALDARARHAWIFRVFHEMSSAEIAAHPDVRTNPPHVDVILQRARRKVGACMQAMGHEPKEVPTGAFMELWVHFHAP
jgi:RNA polymerase sigma factor (sigma-70 family)